MKILRTSDYRLMIDTIKKQDEDLKKAKRLLNDGLSIMKSLKAENDYLKSLIKFQDIDFPNSNEGSKTNIGKIDINDILSN